MGALGDEGDGGPAVKARLNEPVTIVFDADDNLFIADSENGRIRRVDAATGIISTFAGGGDPAAGNGDGGPAGEATLQEPWGLVIHDGFLYVSESGDGGNRVRRIDLATATISTVAGSGANPAGGFSGDGGPALSAQLHRPLGLAFDRDGNLYIADDQNLRIRRVDTNGIITTYAGGGTSLGLHIPATSASIGSLAALAVDPAGNLYLFADPVLLRVDKATGTITQVISRGGFFYGLVFDNAGTMYFSDDASDLVYSVAPGANTAFTYAGGGSYIGEGHPATEAILDQPQGIASDVAGNLYIADYYNNIVRKVAVDGTITTVAGVEGDPVAGHQEGRPATQGNIGYPNDVALDASGHLYIADSYNQRVWWIDDNGKIGTYAGGGSPDDGFGDGGSARDAIVKPYALAFDNKGNLYIADADFDADVQRSVVRRVDTHRNISTFAGSYYPGYSGDGGRATNAELSSPVGLAIAVDGSVYISEFDNNSIRRVDPNGRISSVIAYQDDSVPLGDEGPAIAARAHPTHLFFDQKTGDLYMADLASNRIRRIDDHGIIHTVAGSNAEGGFSGDGGPATAARIDLTGGDYSGIVVTLRGDVYFADSENSRIRVLFACGGSVAAPALVDPADNALNASQSTQLTWTAAAGALQYDVLLDTNNPPATVVGSNVMTLSFTPANLHTGTKYYWQVVAKGDVNCPTPASAPSAVRSFITTGDAPPHRRAVGH
jgi:sugar lactone lactonase YvrE